MSETKQAHRIFEYYVDENHSTVLGYDPKTKTGQHLWQELDWSRFVLKDGGQHMMNPAGGEYLHVWCKDDGKRYRVRCKHEIGTKWRRGVVTSVEASYVTHQGWKWIVGVKEGDYDE